MKYLILFCCFLGSTVFAQSFPHLLISPERLSEIQTAVTVPGGKGLERANVGKAYAVAYDLAYNGWSSAQRSFVAGKLQSSLEYWEGDCFRFDNDINPYASNWVAVCYGSNLLQMLVLNQQGARQSHYDLLVSRLNMHMSHYGNKGWTQEGNYYMTYAQQYRIPMYGGAFDAAQSSTQWGVGGNDFGRQGWTSMIFSIVPEETLGAYRYFYDLYDLYVYFAGTRQVPPRTQRITVNGESKFIRDDTGGWNGVLEESLATSAADAVDGPAYVVFQ
ncbi:MAG: hypothetical protein JJU05_00095 [Verrucomicrobia bacterium]|nr:hypothetical protein [Verrucomicrobiota bacterium]MCH8526227.1 hypothetical protein [Kiritimatiellia bacterium]